MIVSFLVFGEFFILLFFIFFGLFIGVLSLLSLVYKINKIESLNFSLVFKRTL